MSKKSQKEAVIEFVAAELGANFVKYQTNALSMLTQSQLESIKNATLNGILNGQIEYSKDISDVSEVKTYARSMVMNHLKKAKELNGGLATTKNIINSKTKQEHPYPKGVMPDLLSEELREFIKNIV